MNNLDQEFENVGKGTEEVSISDLDAALKSVRELELDHAQKKKVSTEAHHKFEEAKTKLIGLLQASGKTRWECDGVVGFTMYDQLKYRVPQTPDDKERFFEFIQSEEVSELMGQDARDIYLKYATVNSQSLGPFCKTLTELAAEKGNQIDIVGLLPPTSESKLRSLPKKK